MPQVFQVLRCYKCLTFQVHQTKKSIKWECKLCSEKQSIKRHYGIGIAKDCRLHVQKLNSMRGEIDELKCGQMQRYSQSDEEVEDTKLASIQTVSQPQPPNSKWSDYLEVPETIKEEKNDSMSFGDAEVVLEIPKKRRKQSSIHCKSNEKVASAIPTINPIKEYSNYPKDKVLAPLSNVLTQKYTNHSNYEKMKELHPENSSYQPSNVECSQNTPPVVNKQSKWAEFIEDEDPDIKPSTVVGSSQSHSHIFSLCEDTDLDDVLNI